MFSSFCVNTLWLFLGGRRQIIALSQKMDLTQCHLKQIKKPECTWVIVTIVDNFLKATSCFFCLFEVNACVWFCVFFFLVLFVGEGFASKWQQHCILKDDQREKRFHKVSVFTGCYSEETSAAINRPIRFFHDVGLALFSWKPTEVVVVEVKGGGGDNVAEDKICHLVSTWNCSQWLIFLSVFIFQHGVVQILNASNCSASVRGVSPGGILSTLDKLTLHFKWC